MNIVYRCKTRGRVCTLPLHHPVVLAVGLGLLFVLVATMLYAGYQWGRGQQQVNTEQMTQRWQQELQRQKQALSEARRQARDALDALAMRLGRMQARIMRLDAMGQRITDLAGLEKGEFDFSRVPAQGGPVDDARASSMALDDVLWNMDILARQLDDRERQLGVLESMLMNRNLADAIRPSGRPVAKGWLSSRFGKRADPFSGKQVWHEGVDFAGQEGSDVLAVAAGVVTWAAKRYGYGKLVEINHGNGFVTRYGHNKKLLVEVGDTVSKGQVVALMGSTGRSTGPHVHYEVLYKGKPVDPARYVASR